MIDTPRTDKAEKHAYEFKDEYTPVCESKLVRILERELNAANDRIKRMEEAGDLMGEWLANSRNLGADPFLSELWRKAKEDKP